VQPGRRDQERERRSEQFGSRSVFHRPYSTGWSTNTAGEWACPRCHQGGLAASAQVSRLESHQLRGESQTLRGGASGAARACECTLGRCCPPRTRKDTKTRRSATSRQRNDTRKQPRSGRRRTTLSWRPWSAAARSLRAKPRSLSVQEHACSASARMSSAATMAHGRSAPRPNVGSAALWLDVPSAGRRAARRHRRERRGSAAAAALAWGRDDHRLLDRADAGPGRRPRIGGGAVLRRSQPKGTSR
jgi:hypothetical protein